MLVVCGAHEPDCQTIWVFDYRVSGTPKCVKGWLKSLMATLDHVFVCLIDLNAAGEAQTNNDTAMQVGFVLPAFISCAGEFRGIPFDQGC